MYSDRCGASIMKVISKKKILLLLELGAVLSGFMYGCGGDQSAEQAGVDDATVSDAPDEPVTLADTIELALNEALRRVKYGDKSNLYENEFDYLKDQMGYDKYLTLGPVRYAEADSLSWVDVVSVDLYDTGEYDSAWIDVVVNFEGPLGDKHSLEDRIVVYRHNGRWIKPTASVISQQIDYDRIIHEADSAAAAEEEGWDD